MKTCQLLINGGITTAEWWCWREAQTWICEDGAGLDKRCWPLSSSAWPWRKRSAWTVASLPWMSRWQILTEKTSSLLHISYLNKELGNLVLFKFNTGHITNVYFLVLIYLRKSFCCCHRKILGYKNPRSQLFYPIIQEIDCSTIFWYV